MSGDAGEEAGSADEGIGDPDPSVATSQDRPDPGGEPWPLGKFASGEGEPPAFVQVLGDLGIYLGLAAVGLAIVGLVAGTLAYLPIARVAIFFAIVLGSIAMGLGVVFQIFAIRA